MDDERFAHISKDPKFRRIPKAQSKVKIDRRFQSMFTDKQFQVNYTTDKRGRPVKHRSKDDLKRYYEVSSDEESESSEDEEKVSKPGQFVGALQSGESSNEGDSGSDSEIDDIDLEGDVANKLSVKDKGDKKLPEDIKEKLRNLNVDYARGERTLCSDSSSDDEETDDEISESEEIDHKWAELDADAEETEEATYRLAACNLDWDRIRAVDLMVLFNSFLPPGGFIKSVVIYPSEFGKQRMKEEEVKGPIELVKSKNQDRSDDETEQGSKYHMEKLRRYQLNRLKYYYAVITFESANSANKVYTECDGMEYESSATKMDLRFIPDDMSFEDVPKESCEKLPEKYEPRVFTTTALQQAKVELTWDETNPDRLEFAEKMNSGKINDVSEHDLQNYLAASSDEEESSDDDNNDGSDSENSQPGNAIDKYKVLLQEIQEKEEEKNKQDIGMEISWGIDLKEKTDKLVKEKLRNKEEQTPFQQYLDKRKEKRKERKEMKKKSKDDDSENSDVPSDIDMNDPYFAEEFNNPEFKKNNFKKKNKKHDDIEETEDDKLKEAELDLLLMNGQENEEKKHFNLKKIQEKGNESKTKKKKNKKQKDNATNEDNFKVNVEDSRFSAIFTSHHYNIDPTDPHFKKTEAMETLIQEKLKRRSTTQLGNTETKKLKQEERKGKKKDVELNMLVKNIKRNAHGFKKK